MHMNCYLMHVEWKGQLKLHQKKIFWCFSITFPAGPCPIFNCKMMQFWGHNFPQYCIPIMSHIPTMLHTPSPLPNRLFLNICRNIPLQKDNTGNIFPSRYHAKIPRKWAKYLHFSIVQHYSNATATYGFDDEVIAPLGVNGFLVGRISQEISPFLMAKLVIIVWTSRRGVVAVFGLARHTWRFSRPDCYLMGILCICERMAPCRTSPDWTAVFEAPVPLSMCKKTSSADPYSDFVRWRQRLNASARCAIPFNILQRHILRVGDITGCLCILPSARFR